MLTLIRIVAGIVFVGAAAFLAYALATDFDPAWWQVVVAAIAGLWSLILLAIAFRRFSNGATAAAKSWADSALAIEDHVLHNFSPAEASPSFRYGLRYDGAPVVYHSAKKLAHISPSLGWIMWNPQTRMQVGRSEIVEVRLGDAAVAVNTMISSFKAPDTILQDRAEVAPTMRVQLTCDPVDFDIRGLSSVDQLMKKGAVARWDFDVTPKRGGRRKLRLLVTIRQVVEGSAEVIDLPSYQHEVQVAVAPLHTAGKFLKTHWQWVAGTLAVPLLIWFLVGTGLADVIIDAFKDWSGMTDPAESAANKQ